MNEDKDTTNLTHKFYKLSFYFLKQKIKKIIIIKKYIYYVINIDINNIYYHVKDFCF
jgi:hypothetical protein